ncbi:hypothetical protein BDV95DRAFT_528056, partial [Massariosphaeria phaeospora]
MRFSKEQSPPSGGFAARVPVKRCHTPLEDLQATATPAVRGFRSRTSQPPRQSTGGMAPRMQLASQAARPRASVVDDDDDDDAEESVLEN